MILGQTFNAKTGGGITQSNLFAGWDKDNLAVACTAHLLAGSDSTVCENYYQLGEKEHKWVFPFNFIQKKFPSGLLRITRNQSQSINQNTVAKTSIRTKIVDSVFFPFLEYTGLVHCISKLKLSDDFCKWLKEFNPDVIYAQGRDRERILFCLVVQDYLKKPMVFHMMDDWPATISERGPLKGFWRRKINREVNLLFDRAALLMSVSDDMAAAYKDRYHKDFVTFHNPIDIQFWKSSQKTNYDLSKQPTILYAGKISLGVESSLESIARAVQIVNKELNTSMRFVLQTKTKPEWADRYDFVQHRSFVLYKDLPKVFAASDFLTLPYDFSERSIRYVRYSMPTKAPEYMITGSPIIIFAPEVTAIAKYAQDRKWGAVVTENNVNALAQTIKGLVQNKNLREQLGSNAKQIAEKNYNSENIRAQFRRTISSLVDNPGIPMKRKELFQ